VITRSTRWRPSLGPIWAALIDLTMGRRPTPGANLARRSARDILRARRRRGR
jgi:hypothetical protein